MPLSAVYLLEATGAPPSDTTVTVTAGNARVIVIRHAPPDNAGFVEVAFDSASFAAVSGAQIPVSVRPRPGVYGIDLEVGAPLRSARVTFRYAVHFLAPAGALQKYGNDIAFERVLQIGGLDGEIVTFFPTARPATDNLTALVPSAGTYVVAAPR